MTYRDHVRGEKKKNLDDFHQFPLSKIQLWKLLSLNALTARLSLSAQGLQVCAHVADVGFFCHWICSFKK